MLGASAFGASLGWIFNLLRLMVGRRARHSGGLHIHAMKFKIQVVKPARPFRLGQSRSTWIVEQSQHSVLIEPVEFPGKMRVFLDMMRRIGMEHHGDMSMTRSPVRPAS